LRPIDSKKFLLNRFMKKNTRLSKKDIFKKPDFLNLSFIIFIVIFSLLYFKIPLFFMPVGYNSWSIIPTFVIYCNTNWREVQFNNISFIILFLYSSFVLFLDAIKRIFSEIRSWQVIKGSHCNTFLYPLLFESYPFRVFSCFSN